MPQIGAEQISGGKDPRYLRTERSLRQHPGNVVEHLGVTAHSFAGQGSAQLSLQEGGGKELVVILEVFCQAVVAGIFEGWLRNRTNPRTPGSLAALRQKPF